MQDQSLGGEKTKVAGLKTEQDTTQEDIRICIGETCVVLSADDELRLISKT